MARPPRDRDGELPRRTGGVTLHVHSVRDVLADADSDHGAESAAGVSTVLGGPRGRREVDGEATVATHLKQVLEALRPGLERERDGRRVCEMGITRHRL